MKAFSAASAICTTQQGAVTTKLTGFVTVVELSILQRHARYQNEFAVLRKAYHLH